MDAMRKASMISSSEPIKRYWIDTNYDKVIADIDDEALLWRGIREKIGAFLAASSASWRDAVEQHSAYDAQLLPVQLREAEEESIKVSAARAKAEAELDHNHSSTLFLFLLLVVLAFHLGSEWVLNVAVLPPLISMGGFFGYALALTAALAPLILERVFGSTMGDDPWDAHRQAQGWRRIFLLALAILNGLSIFFVASCRTIAAILAANPDATGLKPDEQTLVDQALVLLSFTIALNAGVFALYAHAEWQQRRQHQQSARNLAKARKEEAELARIVAELKEKQARAQVREKAIQKECDTLEAEFKAQRELALEARIARIKTTKDPRAITTFVEQMEFADAMLGSSLDIATGVPAS